MTGAEVQAMEAQAAWEMACNGMRPYTLAEVRAASCMNAWMNECA